MPVADPSPPSNSDRTWLRAGGGFTMLIALTVATGWIRDIPALITLAPGGTPMVMNTAVGIFLAGLGWLALSFGWARSAATLGGGVILLCLWVLVEAASGVSLGTGDFFWHHQYALDAAGPDGLAGGA
jgi:hypothetical protein